MSGFAEQPIMQMLPDGRRLHLRNGPIDLIIEAVGAAREVEAAYDQACAVFPGILGGLAGELPILRAPVSAAMPAASGPVALRMQQAALRHAGDRAFLTPMICVAGAVADHLLAAMCAGRDLRRASVNNGGDIALYLAEGECVEIGICANPQTGEMAGRARVACADQIGGIATSGWRGRSHSLGIADAVTVLARTAAEADAAATLIANAIDLPGHPAVARTPAQELSPDSDLGPRPVTRHVGFLTETEIKMALHTGQDYSKALIADHRIAAVYGYLQGHAFALNTKPAVVADPLEKTVYA
ncbi:MAG: UPF0280 family protein [Pseudomonadota bacterium]